MSQEDDRTRDHWAEAEHGADLLEAGDAKGAIAALTAVITANPSNEYAYFFLGAAHFECEHWEKALKAYLSAIQLTPQYLGAIVGAGHALRMLGRTTDAIRMGKQALSLKKLDSDALYLLGITHFHRGEEAAAKPYLELFLTTNPEVEPALEVRGMLEVIAGQVLPFNGQGDDTLN
jgi:cytochrome c-type biogenesis protein CcmH/NrfG